MSHDSVAPEDLLPLPTATFHILVALAESDRHGYAIMRDVEEQTGGKTRLNPGTLYTSIRRLLDQGLIVERDDPGDSAHSERRRCYSLTPFGRRVARLEFERLDKLVSLGRHAGLARRHS